MMSVNSATNFIEPLLCTRLFARDSIIVVNKIDKSLPKGSLQFGGEDKLTEK